MGAPRSSESSSGSQRRGPWTGDDSPRRLLATIGGLVGIAFLFGGIQLASANAFSPYDEAAHVDYAWKVAHGELVLPGVEMAPKILNEWSCHGQHNVQLPACDSGASATSYPAKGENYLMHPPVYYAVTGLIGRAIDLLSIGLDFTSSARIANLFWLALGMAAFYVALRVWRTPWLFAATASALIPTLHLLFLGGTSVTNDVTAIGAGAAAVFLLGRILVHGAPSLWITLTLAAFFTAAKVLNGIPFLAVGAVLLILALTRRRFGDVIPRTRVLLPSAIALLVTPLIVNFGWTALRSAARPSGWVSPVAGVNNELIVGSPIGEWLGTLFNGLSTYGYGFSPVNELEDLGLAWNALAKALLLAAPFALFAASRFPNPSWVLAAVTALGMLAVPTVVQLQTYIVTDGLRYFPAISARYSLSILLLMLACLAITAGSKNWRVAAWVVTGIALSATFGTIVLG